MSLAFTAVYRQVPEGYIDANRALSEEELQGTDVIREPFRLTA